MKKILGTLFFLGITTTGFAQWSVSVTNSIKIVSSNENIHILKYKKTEKTCFRLSGAPGGGVRVEVPELEIDEVISSVEVNGTQAESLPPEIIGNGELYHIEMIPFEDIE